MKKFLVMVGSCMICGLFISGPAAAEDMSNYELNERVKKLEEKMGAGGGAEWTDRITISGAIEAEAGFVNTDYDDPGSDDVDSSDIVLSTVELGVDAEIHKHVSGHILFLYEEGEDIVVDEGFITIDGKDVVPLYLNAGQIYLPFGQFESHMITDPLTLDLGETSDSAVQVGFANDIIDASVVVFNGDIDESDEDDDTIASYAAGITFSLPDGSIPNVGLSAGVSYISNIADTDGFEGFLEASDQVEDHVAGVGAFVSLSFMDMIFIEAEYIGALDDFEDGDIGDAFDEGDESKPSAMNVELAVALLENLELAVRYGTTDDIKGGIDDESLPETQYGITAAYGLFDSTTLALEYLKSDYENDDEETVITAQLAIEF